MSTMQHGQHGQHGPSRDAGTFDVVVVGGGSAGAVVAARLSEDPGRRVLLLEAGGDDKAQEIHIPAAFSKLFKSGLDWNYETTPQPELAGRTVYWPRGKVLGGSSSINAMMWVRGFAADYDRWAELAGPDWSYEALLPTFRQVEDVQDATDPEHGTGGAIRVEAQRDPRPQTAAFLEAATQAGYDVVPANSRQPDGFSQTMVSETRGARHSTVDGYLRPAKDRPNLTVRTGSHATRVLFDGTRATGVEYVRGGETQHVTARHEVVLSGGAVNTPQLLMLSGIGPAAHLREHGIDVLVDAPEVGANLRDHLMSLFVVESGAGTLKTAETIPQLARYLLQRRGMLTSNVGEAYGFVRSRDDLALPDVEIIFAPVAYVDEGLSGIPSHAVSLGPILVQPRSTGTVRLASSDPLAKPVVDPRYLSDPDGVDRAALLSGLAITERILRSPALAAITHDRYLRPARGEDMTPEQRAGASLATTSHTLYHPTSTVRMGLDPAAPVDPELRVRGVRGLRVADASVMPEIIRGHTNAPSIVIGERAAALVAASARAGAAVADV
ncbi:GMC family oxidoreductase [Luteimicrobium subarcticum]|uniref:Choline dehydrogenase n=1 Tax=Luteimicrobium subarcticum TaxID=620910 RepID=A0A2M8WW59_9MICO|nr:GMC family oxidoreductase N-terminal domain-containing protein [Luteimicrobium subarcticum]PJI95159.1 choline dehydrogenase [Luteimicrobium subarcticum]